MKCSHRPKDKNCFALRFDVQFLKGHARCVSFYQQRFNNDINDIQSHYVPGSDQISLLLASINRIGAKVICVVVLGFEATASSCGQESQIILPKCSELQKPPLCCKVKLLSYTALFHDDKMIMRRPRRPTLRSGLSPEGSGRVRTASSVSFTKV